MTLDRQALREELDNYFSLGQASLLRSKSDTPFEIIPVTLDLTTARAANDPFIVNFPFKSIYVSSASDTSTSVNCQVDTSDSYQGVFPLGNKDSMTFPFPRAKANLSWSAQAGKSITIIFFVTGEFKSGTVQSQLIGAGVASTFIPKTAVLVAAAASTPLIAANTSRTKITFQNLGPDEVYISGSVAATVIAGYALAPSTSVTITSNTSAFCAIAAAADSTVKIIEES